VQAVFLDRDGVINENRSDHVKSWSEFCFLPGALDAIARLSAAGLRMFVITNQAIVNRGTVSRQAVDAVNARMLEAIERRGGRIAGLAYCPHRPEERCGCRKPQPGLLLQLADRHALSLPRCVVVGDALTDMAAGRAAGCRTIMVLTGRGREQLAQATPLQRRGLIVVANLEAAAGLLLAGLEEARCDGRRDGAAQAGSS
jgi:D-glycero-D-manno-heptose 1,7-bisphosphate phosphatase